MEFVEVEFITVLVVFCDYLIIHFLIIRINPRIQLRLQPQTLPIRIDHLQLCEKCPLEHQENVILLNNLRLLTVSKVHLLLLRIADAHAVAVVGGLLHPFGLFYNVLGLIL